MRISDWSSDVCSSDLLDPAAVTIVDPFAAPRAGIAQFASLAEWLGAGGGAEWIMLGMKPQQLGDVANELAEVVTGETHLLSILAGVSLADLAARFPAARARVRILPNLAARTIGSAPGRENGCQSG